MDKRMALSILTSIHQNLEGQWIIPHRYQYLEKEVTLSNGEKATLVVDDAVEDFLDYVEKLIEKEE